MNFQEAINEIKKVVFWDQVQQAAAPVAAPVVPDVTAAPSTTDYKLKDGSTISIDKLEVGGIVTVDGEPAADAEYQLENGNIVQTSGGIIVELSSPQEDLIPEEMKCLPAQMAALQVELAAAKVVIDSMKKEVEASKEGFKLMFELIEKIGEQSVAAPTEEVKWEDMTPLQKFRLTKAN